MYGKHTVYCPIVYHGTSCLAVSLMFFSLQVVFTVTVKAAKCLKAKSFNIGPLGFNEKLKVLVKTRCECECDNHLGVHEFCNGHGTINCGICRYKKTSLLFQAPVAHLLLLLLLHLPFYNQSNTQLMAFLHLPHFADDCIHIQMC